MPLPRLRFTVVADVGDCMYACVDLTVGRGEGGRLSHEGKPRKTRRFFRPFRLRCGVAAQLKRAFLLGRMFAIIIFDRLIATALQFHDC